jgi:hypothetical protein
VLSRQPTEVHVPVRSSFAALFGYVMPFWMAGSTVLTFLLLLTFAHFNKYAWRPAAIALIVQVLAVIFSLAGPVPINSQIAKWTTESLLRDCRAQEHLWDVYHWVRTCGLIAAFAILVVSTGHR